MDLKEAIREEIEQYFEAFAMVIRDAIEIKHRGKIEIPTFEELEQIVIEEFIDLFS